MKYTIEHTRTIFGEPSIELIKTNGHIKETFARISDVLLCDLLIIFPNNIAQVEKEIKFAIRWEIDQDEKFVRENSSPETIEKLIETGELLSDEKKEEFINEVWTTICSHKWSINFN